MGTITGWMVMGSLVIREETEAEQKIFSFCGFVLSIFIIGGSQKGRWVI